MAKDETEVGITGQPVPKPRTAIQQYKLEKKRRERKHLGKNVGGFSYSSDVNPYLNPRSVREEILVDYLLEEGFASDEKSAQAIAGAMSEEWKQSIVEAKEDEGLSPLVKRQTRNDRIRSEVSSSDPEAHTEPELENSRRVMHKAMRGQKKPEAKSRPTGPGKYGAMERRGMGVSDKFRKEVLKRKLN